MSTLSSGRIGSAQSKLRLSRQITAQRQKLNAAEAQTGKIKKRSTRKAGQLSPYEQMKLMRSIENDNAQVIQDFVMFNVSDKLNQPLNLPATEGFTLLELSVHYGRPSIVEILL